MHYNYMTGEHWRIWHSISHRFPFWDKKDKHSALLLQEGQKNSPPAISGKAVGCEPLSGADAFHCQTMICVRQGNGLYKVRKPPGPRCVSSASWECALSPKGPYTLPGLYLGSSQRGAAPVCFSRALSVLGDTRAAFHWISPLFLLDCCDFNQSGRSTSRTEVWFGVRRAWL